MQPKFIQDIELCLSAPLPGEAAQNLMMATHLREKRKRTSQQMLKSARQAGVMLLLFQKDNKWFTALMQRPESPYVHSKQISFPGGGLEAKDVNLEACAKRETEEEFGIPQTAIQVLGALSSLYIPVSRYLVHPFVGYLEEAPIYHPDPSEVDEILEVSLDDLLNPTLRKFTNIRIANGQDLKDVPYFAVEGKVVWGATAMMLSEFVYLLEQMR